LREGYKAYRDERYWQLYVQVYPEMTQETFISFEEFKKSLTSPVKHHTKGQILKKVEGILDRIDFKKQE
jgi:hypothetical protein